jgi:hypothetical protein
MIMWALKHSIDSRPQWKFKCAHLSVLLEDNNEEGFSTWPFFLGPLDQILLMVEGLRILWPLFQILCCVNEVSAKELQTSKVPEGQKNPK